MESWTRVGLDLEMGPEGPTGAEGGPASRSSDGETLGSLGPVGAPEGAGVVPKDAIHRIIKLLNLSRSRPGKCGLIRGRIWRWLNRRNAGVGLLGMMTPQQLLPGLGVARRC